MNRRTWPCRGCATPIASPFFTACDACSRPRPRSLAALLALVLAWIGGAP
jgi:hypothetical protein